ncbi:hypothetical protein TVAG_254620, partial [Trichomonas vaginalis G3]
MVELFQILPENERTSLNGYRITMANIGIILGAALFAILADGEESALYPRLHSVPKAYGISGLIFGLA